jgi:hypothetical protein
LIQHERVEVTVVVFDTMTAEGLSAAMAKLGATVRPLAPGADDPQLSRYFVVDAPDLVSAEAVQAELVRTPGIEAAYIKPPDALP